MLPPSPRLAVHFVNCFFSLLFMQRLITITRHLKEAQFNSIAISANVIVLKLKVS